MSRMSKACNIPEKVRLTVWERDKHRCVVCGSCHAQSNSHYIRRSQGGLGIEENIVTMCRHCHDEYDNGSGKYREHIAEKVCEHLKKHYPDWNEEDLIYDKYKWVRK